MKKLLILLFIPFGLSAQFNVTDGEGNRVFINGGQVRSVGVPSYSADTGTTYDGEPIILWEQKFDGFSQAVPKLNLNTTDRDELFDVATGSDGWGFDGIFNVDLVIVDGDTALRLNMIADLYDPESGSSCYKILRDTDLGGYTELWQGIIWRASDDFWEEDGGKAFGGWVVGDAAKSYTGGAGPPPDGINLRGSWNGEASGDAAFRWYYYWVGQETLFGDNSSNFELPWESSVNDYYESGELHYFASRIVVNTAGDSTQQYVEGWDSEPGTSETRLSHRMDSLRMREEDSILITYIPVMLFRGGNDAPSFDTHVDIYAWWIFRYADAANTITDQERGDTTMILTFPWDL